MHEVMEADVIKLPKENLKSYQEKIDEIIQAFQNELRSGRVKKIRGIYEPLPNCRLPLISFRARQHLLQYIINQPNPGKSTEEKIDIRYELSYPVWLAAALIPGKGEAVWDIPSTPASNGS